MTDAAQFELRLAQLETATTLAVAALGLCIDGALRELPLRAQSAFRGAVEVQWIRQHDAGHQDQVSATAEKMIASLIASLDELK